MSMRQALATLAVLLLVPSAASAATVEIDYSRDDLQLELVYAAAAGEANHVELSIAGTSMVVRDTAGVQAGPGCRQEGPNMARCTPPENWPGPSGAITIVDARLGDLADSLRNSTTTSYLIAFVLGEAGDDRIVGGSSFDVFDGGAGRDRLEGGDGGDLLTDDGGVEPDVLDGGAAIDEVSYSRRPAGVVIDLRNPANPSGEPGENDSLVDFERARGGRGSDLMRAGNAAVEFFGGSGDDKLLGTFDADRLYGETGNDKLHGLGGGDRLVGGSGNDGLNAGCGRAKLFGQQGRDRLYSANGAVDRADGGADRDFARIDQVDVARRVERVQRIRVDACPLDLRQRR